MQDVFPLNGGSKTNALYFSVSKVPTIPRQLKQLLKDRYLTGEVSMALVLMGS